AKIHDASAATPPGVFSNDTPEHRSTAANHPRRWARWVSPALHATTLTVRTPSHRETRRPRTRGSYAMSPYRPSSRTPAISSTPRATHASAVIRPMATLRCRKLRHRPSSPVEAVSIHEPARHWSDLHLTSASHAVAWVVTIADQPVSRAERTTRSLPTPSAAHRATSSLHQSQARSSHKQKISGRNC